MIAQPHYNLMPDPAKLGKLPAALPMLSQGYSVEALKGRMQPNERSPLEAVKQLETDVEGSREYFELFQGILALFKQAGLRGETAKQVDERMGDYTQVLAEGNRWIRLLDERVDILTKVFQGLSNWVKQSDRNDQIEETLKRTAQIRLRIKQYGQIVQEFDRNWSEELLAKILIQVAKYRTLSAKEKIFLLDAAKIDVPIKKMPSMRREDWYGDDGR